MGNRHDGIEIRDLFVWVDPKNWLIQHQVGLIGSFTSTPIDMPNETLMFIPNPYFKTFISPFQNNLLTNYMAEYNLEVSRKTYFSNYPCRLQAIFLFDSEGEAKKYKERHFGHVGNRILKRVKTVGSYLFSEHDSSWVDFMRIGLSMDHQTINSVTNEYWQGTLAKDTELFSMGKLWTEDPIMEILFLGRVDFYEKSLGTL